MIARKPTIILALKTLIVLDGFILLLNFLKGRFGIELFIPAPGERLNNPFALLLILLFLRGVFDLAFRDKWLGRLRGWVTVPDQRKRFFPILVGCIAFLEVMHFSFSHSINWDLDKEQSFGTYFSTAQLFVLGLVVLLIAGHRRRKTNVLEPTWYVIASLFFYLALDDCIGIHENFKTFLQPIAPEAELLHLFHEWLWVYAPFIIAVVVFLARFFWVRFRNHPSCLWISFTALTLWVSVILLEGLARKVVDPKGHYYSTLLEGAEEGAEMLGATLFLLAFANYLAGLNRDAPPDAGQRADTPNSR